MFYSGFVHYFFHFILKVVFSSSSSSSAAPWVLHLAESVDHDSVAKIRAIVAVVVVPHESTVGLERRINFDPDLDQPVQFYYKKYQKSAVVVEVCDGLASLPVGVVGDLKRVLPHPETGLSNIVEADPVVEVKRDQTVQGGLPVKDNFAFSCHHFSLIVTVPALPQRLFLPGNLPWTHSTKDKTWLPLSFEE